MQEVFDTRADEGFEGSGYDWSSLAQVFLGECCPDLKEKINFDPEADMFCACSADRDALADFILQFKSFSFHALLFSGGRQLLFEFF